MSVTDRPKLCIIATVAPAFNVFMHAHIIRLAEEYEVYLISSADRTEISKDILQRVTYFRRPIYRNISIIADAKAFFSLHRLFRKHSFSAVLSLMPKSGLLSMLAGFMAGVPVRVHIFTGQVWLTKIGIGRALLIQLDKLTAAAATSLLTDSYSQKKVLVEAGICGSRKISVLANGSICGVDLLRFRPQLAVRDTLRKEMHIEPNSVVFLFIGRVNRDKGILDLIAAFNLIREQYHAARLLIVGPDDGEVASQVATLVAQPGSRISRFGHTSTPERYMAAADVFCMPSYREGFGLAVIEAAGVGLPAIVSQIYGLTDAVKEDETGLFHQPGSVQEIVQKMERMIGDPSLRKEMGTEARRRAAALFAQHLVVDSMLEYLHLRICKTAR